MKNEKDLIDNVASIYAMNTNGAGKREKDLAKFILKNYYYVDTFFLNRENDYSSGINLDSVKIFNENMVQVRKAISGEF